MAHLMTPNYAPPFVWYLLRPADVGREPAFRVGRAARAFGPVDAAGRIWLLDADGAARSVTAEHFLRRDTGTSAPGGIRFLVGTQIVSAFLVDGIWQLAAGGHTWLAGPLMAEGDRPDAVLARLRFWAEQNGVVQGFPAAKAGYSTRIASRGSARVERRVGSKPARTAKPGNRSPVTPNGSSGETP